MMSLIPFIFFLVLTIYWFYEHKGLDVCVYMAGLYALSTLFAVYIILSGNTEGTDGGDSGGMLWAGWEPVLGIVPTVVFCALIGISMLPFSFIHTKEIKTITTNSPWLLLGLSALLISVGLINLYCVADSTLEILSGDFAAIRQSANNGDQTPADIKIDSLPFPLGHIMYFRFSAILALPIMFHNICFGNKPWWWNALLFFTSLTSILAGIQRADRTEPIFFAIMFVFCLLFFRHAFTKKVKIVMNSVIIGLALIGTIYITAVSMARFEDRKNGGAMMSVAHYTGQGYLNFCYFWENANPNEYATEREFPIYNHYVNQIDSNPDRRGERSAKHGFFISVFATFIGDLLLDIGAVGMTIWVLLYTFITAKVIKWKHRSEYDISEVLILFVLASIPLFGIFYYRYFAWMLAYNFIIIVIFRILSKYKFVFRQQEEEKSEANA